VRTRPDACTSAGMLASLRSAVPSSASTPRSCSSRSTSPTAFRPSTWLGCQTPACARAAIASGAPSGTAAWSSRRTGSRSTSRRPTCARRARPSTCRSRWHPRRDRTARATRHPRGPARRRTVARRGHPAGPRGAAGRAGGSTARRRVDSRALEKRPRGGARRRRPVLPADSLPARRRGAGAPRCGGSHDGDPPSPAPPACPVEPDLADVRGQALARRALEVAAAGGHHLVMCGPPGAGKTMLARRLPGVLPPLDPDESLEVTCIHSVAGCSPRASRSSSAAPSGRRTTPSPTRHWWAGARHRGRARSPWPTTVSCSSTRCRIRPPGARGLASAARGRLGQRGARGRTVRFPAHFLLVGAP
jgi:hypothetical protein